MIEILLSTYNGEKYIRNQIDSIINQSFTSWVLLIRDDMSKDNTVNILREYKLKYPKQIFILDNNDKNLGSSNSFIELLKNSTEELIMFCDQDDVWKPNKLQKFYDYYVNNCKILKTPFLIHSYADVVNSQLELMPEETESFNIRKSGMEHDFIWHIFQNDVTGCTVMINKAMKDLFNNYDFDKNKIIQHDWLLAEIAYLYGNKFLIKESTIKYRQHENNVLGAKKITYMERIKLKVKKGLQYSFYAQIKTLLSMVDISDVVLQKKLQEFSELSEKNKFQRCSWHIRNKYRREGNLLYFLYQLISC